MTPEAKALDLVAEHRVVLLDDEPGVPVSRAIVFGHAAAYYVDAARAMVSCTCPARTDYCAHALAAMIVWHDRLVAGAWVGDRRVSVAS